MTGALERWRPAPGAFDRAAAAHLLRRAGFGGTREEVERAVAAGVDGAVDELLARDAHDPGLVDGVRHVLPGGDVLALAAWWMALVLGGGAPLVERTALLWHDHFATSHDKVGDVRLMHRQNALFRARGLGDFRELLHAVLRDPAMLVWLDGDDNVRGRPNENLARELLELFALGRGGYDERDVKEGARALTGRTVRGREYRFDPARHDAGPKRFLGVEGPLDGDGAVDAVLAHPGCPRHVARRLLAELVAPEPEPAWVEDAAATLVASGWSVRAVVERVLRSRVFHEGRARRARIAGPVELVASAARALGARIAPRDAARAAAEMGQALFRPPTVKGWDGGRAWIDAGTWIARHDGLLAVLGANADLRAALGADAGDDPATAAVRALLPERADDAGYLAALRAGIDADADEDEALERAAALVLTSPEWHLY